MLVVCMHVQNDNTQYRNTYAHACTNYKHLKHTNSQTIKQVNKIPRTNTRTNLARFVHRSANLPVYIRYALALALSISTSVCV